MPTTPRFGSPFRRVRRSVLTASILPAALATQAWAVDWTGPVTLTIDPTVAVGLVEGKADGSAFDELSPNFADGPDRDGLGTGVSLGIFMGQETANFAQGTTADFDNFWNDNRTWIYTGEINSGPSGLLSFAESIDDSTRIMIDGVVVLRDTVWDVPTASGVLQFTPNTYHTIEVRMGNGVGGAGPVSVNNFVANVPSDPPIADGYGFGFSHTGATGTDGANYIKPIDPGDGSLFQHETAPAAAANQDVNVIGTATVTLDKVTSDHITENSITFAPTTTPITLTVNGGPTPGGTLRSLSTVLSTTNAKTINIAGDADFAPGSLSTGPTIGTDTVTGIVLQKNGGTGKLILDNATNNLTGATLKVLDGTLSIVGGGGTLNPVSDLGTRIEIGGTATTLAPVLRIGGGIVGTTFANAVDVKQTATIEHVSPGTDTFGGGALPSNFIATGKTLTLDVSNGALNFTGSFSSNFGFTSAGGPITKLGVGTAQLARVNTSALNATAGRLEVAGELRAPTVSIGATGTLALFNTDATNYNRLPATLTVTTGTLEGVPGAFRSGAAGAPTNLTLNGGTLSLGSNLSISPNGLIANLYNNDAGASGSFAAYPTYLSYFAGRGPGTVTNTAANGYVDLAFGLPIGGDPAMFVPIAPSFTATNNIVSRMHGKIYFPATGTYTIGTGSDDGSMVFIDGAIVVSNNLYQAHARRTGTITVDKGLHDIDIGFYEGGGLNSLVVDWSGPGISGTQTIPNTVLLPVPEAGVYNNPVLVPESSTINAALAATVASVNLTVGKTLTVNGYRFNTGALTLNGGAGTYTFNTTTPLGETVVSSIDDGVGDPAVAIVKNGPGTLVLEAGANPQLQSASSSVTATAGGIGLVLGPVNPAGNATINANGRSLLFSSKAGDQSYALPTFTNGGSISAQRIGSGVAGTTGTPIRMTLTGNLALNPATTLNFSTADFYTLVLPGGISGNATVNIDGTVETSGVVNVGGPLNVNFGSTLNVVGGTVSGGPLVVNSGGTLFLRADNVLGNAGGLSNVTVNGGTVTALAGTHSALPSLTLNGGTIGATGPGNAPTGPTINYILDGSVTTVPGDTTPTINAPAILLRGGTNTPVTFTIPRGTADSDLSVTSVIHDGGAGLIKNGDGILTLSGVNTYTGPTVINGGKLEANGSSSLGGSAVRLNNGGVLSLGSPPSFAGFQDFTLNGGASVTNNILTLTEDVGNLSRSAFTTSKYSVGDGFSASFVYKATGAAAPNGLADGITFTVQNNVPTAVGGAGGGLGYTGMLNSASLQFNIYLGAGQPIGTNFRTNGAAGAYISSAPVILTSGNPILVEVVYNSTALTFTETLTDLVTTDTYTNTFNVGALSGVLGGDLAYVGFTGATGGAQALQTVADFVFNDFSQQGIVLPNDITVSAGAAGGLDIPSAGPGVGGNATLEGVLTLNAGSVLNVTGGEVADDAPYLLDVTGPTTLAGNSTIDVANNGTGVGTVQLDAVTQSGGNRSLTKIGEGTLVFAGASSFAVLNSNEGTTNLDATLANATINANGDVVNVNESQNIINANGGVVNVNESLTINALNINATGVVVLGGSTAPAPLAFDAETAGAPAQAVPEPGSAFLLLSGLSALLARRPHRRSLPPH